MSEPDEAQKKRAEKLREEIERIKKTEQAGPRRPAPRVNMPGSPHEFVQRRMRELKKDDDKTTE